MKHLVLIFFALHSVQVFSQEYTVENPRLPFDKQMITIFSDSSFTVSKEVSTDFLKLRLLKWVGQGWLAEKTGTLSTMQNKRDTIFIKDNQFVKTTEYRQVLEKQDPSAEARHEGYYKALVKKYGENIGSGVFFGVPTIGMNKELFFMCKDYPNKINRTETKASLSEQFVYDYGDFEAKYYYFTNGKLTAIQD